MKSDYLSLLGRTKVMPSFAFGLRPFHASFTSAHSIPQHHKAHKQQTRSQLVRRRTVLSHKWPPYYALPNGTKLTTTSSQSHFLILRQPCTTFCTPSPASHPVHGVQEPLRVSFLKILRSFLVRADQLVFSFTTPGTNKQKNKPNTTPPHDNERKTNLYGE